MKRKALIAMALWLFVSSPALAGNPSRTAQNWDGWKDWTPTGTPFEGHFRSGDDIANANVIPALPYTDSFNSCGYANDYDEPCPWGGAAPDVVYAFTPAVNMLVSIDLCESYFDTKVFVYENAAGKLVGRNDDACDGPNYPYPWLSNLECVPMTAGSTYYIVVDGYSQDCGDYVLNVDECVPPEPCDATCPSDATVEQEPGCGTGYVDNYNGGCNSKTPVFLRVPCELDPVPFCGESGTWFDGISYWRDTDWWEFTLSETKTVRFTTCAGFNVQTILIIPDSECGNDTYPYLDTAPPGEEAVIEATLGPGTYWYWVGPASWYDVVPCGSAYSSSVTGWCDPSAAEKTTWGQVKSRFR
ncbi:MAG: hypothetical protein ABIK65_00590 [Candidatus Eisenbacteria bacterium]